jgi:predicted nucleic acid-binding protein
VIVLDASAVLEWMLQMPAAERIESRIYSRDQTLHAPHLLDVEVIHILRRMVRQQNISETRADEAIRDFADARIRLYPHRFLLPRIWEMRHNVSAYDAAYIALAEALGATLVTRDARLASSSGHRASIELY